MKAWRLILAAVVAITAGIENNRLEAATGDDSAILDQRRNGIPIYDVSRDYRRIFHTQVSGTIGSSRVYPGDRPLRSYGVEVKGIHYFCGSLYVSGGAGFNARYSETRPTGDEKPVTNLSRVLILPAGIGWTMGDDNAHVITGIDLEPSWYLTSSGTVPERNRVVGIGLAPEFGFMFRVGRPWQRGMQLGMIGKVHFMQTPDVADGNGLKYGYFGVGLVARF